MSSHSIRLAAAAVLPFALVAGAWAQTTTPETQPQPDLSGYTLKGDALKTPSTQQGGATPYELSGTSISGKAAAAAAILTAPVDASTAPFKMENGLYLYPSVFMGLGTNDNVSRTSNNKISSSFVNVAPQLVAEMRNHGDRYTALVSANTTSYDNSSADNYTNSELTVAGDNYFTSRASAGWSLGHVVGSDPRGSTGLTTSSTPDVWHSDNINGRFNYGAPEAPGRLELDLGNQAKNYDNNLATTAVQDVNLTSAAARVFYRLGSRSQALVEIRQAVASYTSSLSNASNIEHRYYAGLTWDATAATTGIVKLGSMTKDFSSGISGLNGSSWEASVRWLPRTYSAFDLQTAREAADASGVGNYLLTTNNSLSWNHMWTGSVASRVMVGELTTEYVGGNRTDVTDSYTLTLNYAVKRWLKAGVDWSNTNNSSNVAGSAFTRNVLMFTLNATL